MGILNRCTFGFFGGAIVGGAVGAGIGAAAGATGAAILQSAGHAGYSAASATQMVAAGNALINGVVGGLYGAKIAVFGVGARSQQDQYSGGFLASVISYTGSITLGGLTGYGMFKAAGAAGMALDATAAASAVGAAVTAIPVGLVTVCCLGAVLVAATAAAESAGAEMRATTGPGIV